MNEGIPYSITIKKDVIKSIGRLPPKQQERVAQILRSLPLVPRPAGCLLLKGYRNTWRVRLGGIRIIYEIGDEARSIDIVRVDQRDKAYQGL